MKITKPYRIIYFADAVGQCINNSFIHFVSFHSTRFHFVGSFSQYACAVYTCVLHCAHSLNARGHHGIGNCIIIDGKFGTAFFGFNRSFYHNQIKNVILMMCSQLEKKSYIETTSRMIDDWNEWSAIAIAKCTWISILLGKILHTIELEHDDVEKMNK